MGLYAMTGGATGIGAAVKELLRNQGHKVIVVDIKDADIIADLSTSEGRSAAVKSIREKAGDGLNGLITSAGVGANVTDHQLVTQLNYFGTVEIVEGVKNLLQAKKGAVVLVSSTAAPLNKTPDFVDKLLNGESEEATEQSLGLTGHDVYSGTKQAVTRWMRRNVVEYASSGVRVNAIAPGYTETPMNFEAEKTEEYGQAIRDFKASIPVGYSAKPEDQAAVAGFLLSDEAKFICGALIFVDGGHDALFRPDQF